MGSGGPGNIVHIDNLYVVTKKAKTNINIKLGDFLIFDTDGLRPVLTTDFSLNDRFLNLNTAGPVYQALEDANNLNALDAADRKGELSVATTGTSWVTKMAAGVESTKRVGISRLDARTPVIAVADVANALSPTIDEVLGSYKKKEFARVAEDSVLNENGIIATGQVA